MVAYWVYDIFDERFASIVDQSYDELFFIEWTGTWPRVSNTGVVENYTKGMVLISTQNKGRHDAKKRKVRPKASVADRKEWSRGIAKRHRSRRIGCGIYTRQNKNKCGTYENKGV